MFDLDYFRQTQTPFYTLLRTIFPGRFRPTKTHHFIKLLHKKKLLLRNWTQNIDMLERICGIPPAMLVEAHGTFFSASCIECRAKVDPVVLKKIVMAKEEPRCRKCSGFQKPDIVFFGEPLPHRVEHCKKVDFAKCDLLIVAGTSLQVQPFASLIMSVPSSTPRVLLNREAVGMKEMNDNGDSLTGGFRFRREDNYRDVFVQGDCDDAVAELAGTLLLPLTPAAAWTFAPNAALAARPNP